MPPATPAGGLNPTAAVVVVEEVLSSSSFCRWRSFTGAGVDRGGGVF